MMQRVSTYPSDSIVPLPCTNMTPQTTKSAMVNSGWAAESIAPRWRLRTCYNAAVLFLAMSIYDGTSVFCDDMVRTPLFELRITTLEKRPAQRYLRS